VPVLAVPVVDEVASYAAQHAIVATACSDALQVVRPRSTGHGVVTGVTDEHIATTTTSDGVVACEAAQGVLSS
jgi:hypothetical protein